jgi:hypothetical protein
MPANAGAAQSPAEKSTAKRISGHIQQSGQLRNYRIGVKYQNGIALLEGTVTSAEQREAAIRLAKEVKGVKNVECRLECTDDTDSTAAKQIGQQIANEFAKPTKDEKATKAGFDGEPSGVVQAYGERETTQAVPQQPLQRQQRQLMQRQQQPMRARSTALAHRPRMMPRNNMPLGAPLRAPRPGMGVPRPGMDPAVRQASAHDCYQAGGAYGEGYAAMGPGGPASMGPMPAGVVPTSYGRGPSYENAQMPGYAWPSYASYPNYAALTYPQQYSPTAWPYIGPFYPYPQVPLAWRKVSLEWDDGWWFLDFSAHNSSH